MAETMTILEKHSLQTWVALSTLSLLDNSESQMGKSINSQFQRNNLINNSVAAMTDISSSRAAKSWYLFVSKDIALELEMSVSVRFQVKFSILL